MWKIIILCLCFWELISGFTTLIPKNGELCVGANVDKGEFMDISYQSLDEPLRFNIFAADGTLLSTTDAMEEPPFDPEQWEEDTPWDENEFPDEPPAPEQPEETFEQPKYIPEEDVPDPGQRHPLKRPPIFPFGRRGGRNILGYDGTYDGRYTLDAEVDGVYKFCFQNPSPDRDLNIHFELVYGSREEEIVPNYLKEEHLTTTERMVLELSESLYTIQKEQLYLKSRERLHRDTVESTNSRVKWYTVLELFVLVVMSAWQVYALRNFFEVKRRV